MWRLITIAALAGTICFGSSPAFSHLPANGGLTKGAPTNGAPTNGAPTNGTAVNGAPANGAPANGAPANGSPANGAPANGASADDAWANGTSGNYFDARACSDPDSHCPTVQRGVAGGGHHEDSAANAERRAAHCLHEEAADLAQAERLRDAAAADRRAAHNLTENATSQAHPTIPPAALVGRQLSTTAPAVTNTGQANGVSDPDCPPVTH